MRKPSLFRGQVDYVGPVVWICEDGEVFGTGPTWRVAWKQYESRRIDRYNQLVTAALRSRAYN